MSNPINIRLVNLDGKKMVNPTQITHLIGTDYGQGREPEIRTRVYLTSGDSFDVDLTPEEVRRALA